jgi:hypothetical protein
MRRVALALALVFCGCGSDEPPSIAAVKACLEDNGLRVTGGASPRAAGDDDAPDRGELITDGAFIGFYSSKELADKLAAGVEEGAKETAAAVERKGSVTVVYIDTTSKDEIEPCL